MKQVSKNPSQPKGKSMDVAKVSKMDKNYNKAQVGKHTSKKQYC